MDKNKTEIDDVEIMIGKVMQIGGRFVGLGGLFWPAFYC